MITTQKGETLSKIIINHKNKEDRKHKISASFQHLYDILSKKSQTDDISRINYNSVPKARLTKETPDEKLLINLNYQNQCGTRKSSSHIQPTTYKEHSNVHLNVMLEAYYKQRGSITPNEKRNGFSIQKSNERLKNIILGKKYKKSKMFKDKNSFQQEIIPKFQKLQQLNKQKLQVKRSITQNSQHSNYRLESEDNHESKLPRTQIIEQAGETINPLFEQQDKKAKSSEKPPEIKYKKLNNKKKLMIKGCHLQNIMKFAYQESGMTQNLIQKQSPNAILFKSHLSNISTYIQPIKNSKLISSGTKIVKDDQKLIILNKFQPQLLISQHILWKLQKIFNFHQFFLLLFNCQMAQHQSPTQLLKYSRKSNYLKYYVGNGNNRTLIVETMGKRWWWKETSKMSEADFVWTQQKLIKLYSKSSKYNNNQQDQQIDKLNKLDLPTKLKPQNFKLLESQGTTSMKKLLTHSFKAKRKVKQQNPFLLLIDRPTKLHNHLIDSHILGDKKNLFKLLKLWKVNYKSDQISNLYKIIPQTFHIVSQNHQQYLLFKQRFDSNTEENNLWIVKPGQNSNRGRGIFLSNSLDEITESIKVRSELKGTTIVQKYKSDLLLYKGRKFDIRTYLLCIIIGGNCKYFWYSQGYIRTSSHLYNTTELNSMIHLTNDAIQNTGEQYGKFQKGNKLSFIQLQNYINQSYPKEEWKVEQLTNQMKEIAKKVASNSYYLVDKAKKQHGFQLFGMDFIVDSQFNPFLLQVNTNPCLELSSPLLQTIIPNLIENVCRLGLDPLFPPNMLPDKQHQYCLSEKIIESNKFQLIFDSLTERDQLWQKYCDQHWGIQ